MSFLNRFRDVFLFVGSLWVVFALNWALSGALYQYGLVPRHVETLPGILVTPFLHADYLHLLSNSIPLLILGCLVSLERRGDRRDQFRSICLALILFSGGLVWCFGRTALHIGASGVVYGLLGYLLGSAWWRRDFRSIIIAIFVLALYSGLISGLFIPMRGVSFEAHLFGFLSGGLIAYISCRTKKPPRYF
ncbi:hypothetical protein WH95_14075 [Kiloniella litopenaei]|uniref:Peptidase S54 rhomboid domain-containing protein n=1 Tax=Kiloniella litopenaei TaxID=1549748 RepID=A0A0M2R3U8_9PROT|nr:rhomboid family intramembrane serine protease [Kiloniella litopenaei]KKJ76336.1 hypothetical protein WH95_14075 [Kiloniella litopenaei]